MLEFKTAGESHGRGLMAIIDGFPSDVEIDIKGINDKMLRRQGGYGRGGRMKIEKDRVEVFSGLRYGKTIGSPIGLLIFNQDWDNWQKIMAPFAEETDENSKVTRPRPGHADLAGSIKYGTDDIRNILERASARETAARTAVGGVTDSLLKYFNIKVSSSVLQIGEIEYQNNDQELIDYIDHTKKEGDSLGGIIELKTTPLPVGLGSYTQWDKRLDGRLAQALMSIPAIKGVEIGPAFTNATRSGSQVHDQIFYTQETGYYRKTNRAGGLEGGITNGEPLFIRIAMKPIPTLYKPLKSVDIKTKEPITASIERSDITAVPAAAVVAESMVSFIIAQSILEKFAGDNIREILHNYHNYINNSRR
jgi:chorismate synthase